MNLLFKILLSVNATSWMIIIYAIKEKWTLFGIPYYFTGLLLLIIPIILSVISIKLSELLGKDSIRYIKEFSLADNEFLPTYLGYFFVSLSVPEDLPTMLIVYCIVFVFTFVSQSQYFNPIYLVLGYHYYHILTEQGTKVFVISRGSVVRRKEDLITNNLKRINDSTYIV